MIDESARPKKSLGQHWLEFDAKLARGLPARVPESNLEVVHQDILSFDLTTMPADYKVVANIPYYLTSNLIRVLSESPNRPSRAALLIQKEVAQRVAAKPGDMSLLSVTAQVYWEVSLGPEVPAELFTPPPKVDSQILTLNRLPKPLFEDVVPKDFFRLVKAGFAQRRKTLLNSLSSGLHETREQVTNWCEAADIVPTRRPQTLSLDEWHSLYRVINT
jgi:16S rRNA (adenine1518-N6/adenine1519-N6)-dimethyltransferase